ncbi:putative MATE family efflux protein [Alkalibaculum bacchi]|uniref:Probable multidrug resistance protein NorM n=1 Tax=Alkalibaculum bacchi TaxID=645887 RepID=A0A366I9R9_9FIRM|nr:MATE family efflux transporter [Alkalibaculum bacchi]RBP66693.1 putative MATE family efflux protein [Alkalibaculum bacchi]
MKEVNLLTEGSIQKTLLKLALPIMGSSFIQMTYSLADMIFIGKLGSKAVAAVGTAGFFPWLAMAFIMIPKIGAEVGVAQSIGGKNIKSALEFIRSCLQLVIFLALIYSTVLIVFKDSLIDFFHLGDPSVIQMAKDYLLIVSYGMIFTFLNPVLTGVLNGHGNSRTPFYINVIGVITNIILDPLLILGIGPFPVLGVEGAAIATVFAQMIVTFFLFKAVKAQLSYTSKVGFFQVPNWNILKKVFTLGLPVALQNGLFTFISMIIARLIAQWGPVPVAVQQIGSQIESISWNTANGFSTALAAFVGQNYGAKKWDRINKGYHIAVRIMTTIGLITTVLLIFGARPIFSIFLSEKEAIYYGVKYLKILGISQLFMCLEITTAGAFNGLGKTVPPSVVSIVFTSLRIPAAVLLSSNAVLGVTGVWWSVSLSSVIKGIVLVAWYIIYLNKVKEKNHLAVKEEIYEH